MRLSGIAETFNFQSPLDCKLVGANINQDDLPWWAVSILGWISMVRAIRSFAQGKQTPGRQLKLEKLIESGDPSRVIDHYKSFEEYTKYLARGGEQEK